MFNLDHFIGKYVIRRSKSMFLEDIEKNRDVLSEKIHNKKVLVIGGAGSIGSSFIRAILPFCPTTLIVVDINENALAELTRDLRSTKDVYIPDDYVPYPMDYASLTFEKMYRDRAGFDIVANFSAHKHVRSEKDIYSVEALLQNNVLHAKKLLDLLKEFPPEVYFCVSTDKAANPVNIMGASKRIMEDVIFSYSDQFPVKTARFANVAFSNGSLLDGFLTRINKLQPISAPSDVKRYFVSPEESGQICMLACMLGNNREIFFPKLEKEQMMTFDAIAIRLLSEYGFDVELCESDEEAVEKAFALKSIFLNREKNERDAKRLSYPVHFSVSDTSGEKSFEEFYTSQEKVDMARFHSLGVIVDKNIPSKTEINNLLQRLDNSFAKTYVTKEEIVEIIKEYLPNFEHIEKRKFLDSKM